MEQEYAPINHGTASALASTTAGAAGGAVKTGVITGLSWIGITSVLGGIVGSLAVGILTGGVGFAMTPMMWGGLAGGLAGLGGGLLSATTVGGLGAVVGAFKGGSRAANQVGQERAAATMLQAQVEAYKAQAEGAQTVINAPSASNYNGGYPVQGSSINPAMPQIYGAANDNAYSMDAARAATQGTLSTQQIAANR